MEWYSIIKAQILTNHCHRRSISYAKLSIGTLQSLPANRGGRYAYHRPSGQRRGTLISLVPFAIGFAASAIYLGRVYPAWLLWWLWISYASLFVGELKAWWIPYFFGQSRERVARYQDMFSNTHAFLPAHNGIRVNTLHLILHIMTISTLVVLGILTAQQGWSTS